MPTSARRRRFPRFRLDVDWFVESTLGSTMGRGLEVSVRSALLPVVCAAPLAGEVTLFISVPRRGRMVKARCRARHHRRGWVLTFVELAPADAMEVGQLLLCEVGALALPELAVQPDCSIPIRL